MVEIIWREPPTEDRSKAGVIIQHLKQFPGRWAMVQSGMKSSAGAATFKDKGCEAMARRAEDLKTYEIYARWPVSEEYPEWVPPTLPAAPEENDKSAIHEAIAKGTALKPPPPVIPRRATTPAAQPAPANDFGLTKFRAERAARGARA